MNTTLTPRLQHLFAGIEAHVARIPDTRPEPTHIPGPAPSMALLHAAQDEVMEHAAMTPMRAPKPADADDVFSEPDDEFEYETLSLGSASIDVGYVVVYGEVLLQGAMVNDEWVDIDYFSLSMRKTWTRDIERKLERAQA